MSPSAPAPKQDRPAADPAPLVSPPATAALVGLLVLLIAWTAAEMAGGESRAAVDFDVFQIAGRLALEGRAADAYSVSVMAEAEARYAGEPTVLPWSYPPPYILLATGLALLPPGLAYLLFVGGTFAAWLLVLRRIAGSQTGVALLAVFPAAVVAIRAGQNGFLTGALLGLFLLAWMRGGRGGVALGFLALKPHLAAGAGLLALVHWRWGRILACGLTIAGLWLLPVLVFGPSVLPAFLDGAADTSQWLLLGAYPLFRMTSVYAAAFQAGLPAGVAMALQAAVAVAACSAILASALWLRRRRKEGTMPEAAARRVAALTAFGTLLVSPYCYDYDLTMLGIAAAFAWPCLARRAGPGALCGLLALAWLASGWGVLLTTWHGTVLGLPQVVGGGALPSVSAFALAALAIAAGVLLRRPTRRLSPSRRSPRPA